MPHFLFLFTVLLFSFFSQEGPEKGFKVKIGDRVPTFELPLTDGDFISNDDLLGKVSVIQFTASWCGVCKKEMPHLEKEVWQRFKGDDFILLGIDLKEPTEKVKQFIKDTKITYPMALDKKGMVFEQFTIPKAGVTRNIVLDKEGNIIFLTRLFNPDEFKEMIEIIDKELKK